MRRIGAVERAASGIAVVRCTDDESPDVGTELLDEHLDRVGTVVDVFGPVERPYLGLSPPAERTPTDLLGTPCYVR